MTDEIQTLEADLASLADLLRKSVKANEELRKRNHELGMEAIARDMSDEFSAEKLAVAVQALKMIATSYHDVTGGPLFVQIATDALAKMDTMP